jgi:hypothetical protein
MGLNKQITDMLDTYDYEELADIRGYCYGRMQLIRKNKIPDTVIGADGRRIHNVPVFCNNSSNIVPKTREEILEIRDKYMARKNINGLLDSHKEDNNTVAP